MLDQSGSVGIGNHNIALNFLKDVISFYDISDNDTQVWLYIQLVQCLCIHV